MQNSENQNNNNKNTVITNVTNNYYSNDLAVEVEKKSQSNPKWWKIMAAISTVAATAGALLEVLRSLQ